MQSPDTSFYDIAGGLVQHVLAAAAQLPAAHLYTFPGEQESGDHLAPYLLPLP